MDDQLERIESMLELLAGEMMLIKEKVEQQGLTLALLVENDGRKLMPVSAGGAPATPPSTTPVCPQHGVEMEESQFASDDGTYPWYCSEEAAEGEIANKNGFCPRKAYPRSNGTFRYWKPKGA